MASNGSNRDILLIVMLAALGIAALFYLTKSNQPKENGLTLSPEVQNYIDSKLASQTTPGSASCVDLPKLMEQINQMQMKLTSFESDLKARRQGIKKKEKLVGDLEQARQSRAERLTEFRKKEVQRLKAQLMAACASEASSFHRSHSRPSSASEGDQE